MKKSKKDLAIELMEQGYNNDYICNATNSTMSSVKTYRVLFNKKQNGEITLTTPKEIKPKSNEKLSSKMKDVFIALETMIDEDILKKFNLSSKTLETYKTTYRKHFGLPHGARVKFNELSFAQQVYLEGKSLELPKTESDSSKNINFRTSEIKIGNNKYLLDIYLHDGLEWVNFDQLIGYMKMEIKFNIEDPKLQLHEKYIESITVDGLLINLLDINAITMLGVKLGDYTVIDTGVKLTTESAGIFYRIKTIINAIELINVLLEELGQIGTSKLEVYEKIESDLLHELEDNKDNGENLIEISNKLVEVLNERRIHKNDFVLKNSIKNILNDNPNHQRTLCIIKSRLESLLFNLYNKKYNSKAKMLEEDWQKEIVEKHS